MIIFEMGMLLIISSVDEGEQAIVKKTMLELQSYWTNKVNAMPDGIEKTALAVEVLVELQKIKQIFSASRADLERRTSGKDSAKTD